MVSVPAGEMSIPAGENRMTSFGELGIRLKHSPATPSPQSHVIFASLLALGSTVARPVSCTWSKSPLRYVVTPRNNSKPYTHSRFEAVALALSAAAAMVEVVMVVVVAVVVVVAFWYCCACTCGVRRYRLLAQREHQVLQSGLSTQGCLLSLTFSSTKPPAGGLPGVRGARDNGARFLYRFALAAPSSAMHNDIDTMSVRDFTIAALRGVGDGCTTV